LISLAGFKYRLALESEGGPISSLEEGKLEIEGISYAQANARLRDGLVHFPNAELYSNAHGTGVHRSSAVARHIAISEALERWAYYSTALGSEPARYGFEVDPSSNGFAAFPGITVGPARKVALQEAVERYCLLNWWEGNLSGRLRTIQGTLVDVLEFPPLLGQTAVLLHSRAKSGSHIYGHAAGPNLSDAIQKATFEMRRHEWMIDAWNAQHADAPNDPFEFRSWYFSTAQGYKLFESRTGNSGSRLAKNPSVACDLEVVGPWSRYTTVWRFLLKPPSLSFLSDQRDFFYW